MVTWDVSARIVGTSIKNLAAINFWNPDQQPVADQGLVTWSNVTTGGHHAVDLWLDNLMQATLTLESAHASFQLTLSSIRDGQHVVDCGGLDKRVRIQRLPDNPFPTTIDFTQPIALPVTEEARIYVKIVFEDGHVAWTSPIYIRRR
jgi:hypothetical protein